MKMINLPIYTQYHGETKIALIDNSAIAFMEQVERYGCSAKELLREYDVIFIPNWVIEEINDSEYRRGYIDHLVSEGFQIYAIAEESYAELADGEEGNLYKIVFAAVSSLGELKSYMHKQVRKEDPLDMDAYSDWISEMYENWPISGGTTETGRVKKKNAGEISLTILAEVLSWYYPTTEMITVYTQDRDSYNYQLYAHKLLKKNFKEKSPIEVSYKSNDCLLYQMYRNSMIGLEQIEEVRKDVRTVVFTQQRPDQSVVLTAERLDNSRFVELIQDQSVQIIF
jgi:hypothetical protein